MICASLASYGGSLFIVCLKNKAKNEPKLARYLAREHAEQTRGGRAADDGQQHRSSDDHLALSIIPIRQEKGALNLNERLIFDKYLRKRANSAQLKGRSSFGAQSRNWTRLARQWRRQTGRRSEADILRTHISNGMCALFIIKNVQSLCNKTETIFCRSTMPICSSARLRATWPHSPFRELIGIFSAPKSRAHFAPRAHRSFEGDSIRWPPVL